MNKISPLRHFFSFVYYILLQLTISTSMVRFHDSTCFIYLAFLLYFPWQRTSLILPLLVGFVMGALIDILYASLGLHALAAVLMMYSRTAILTFIEPSSRYKTVQPSLKTMGLKSFSLFSLVLIFIHHATLSLIDTWNSVLFWTTMRKTILSTLLTYLAICMTQLISMLLSSRQCHVRQ